MTFNTLHILSRNGWKWELDKCRDEEYDIYSNTFLAEYDVRVYAIVSSHAKHQVIDGHLGVLWLECEYEIESPYGYHDLDSMMWGMELAEQHLLRIGMPFTPDYEFHGRNRANNKRRNDALRRKYNLDELEMENK